MKVSTRFKSLTREPSGGYCECYYEIKVRIESRLETFLESVKSEDQARDGRIMLIKKELVRGVDCY
jgi:hypothetical protein